MAFVESSTIAGWFALKAMQKQDGFRWKVYESRMTFVESSTKTGWLSLKTLQKFRKKIVYVGVPSFRRRHCLTFRRTPFAQLLPPCHGSPLYLCEWVALYNFKTEIRHFQTFHDHDQWPMNFKDHHLENVALKKVIKYRQNLIMIVNIGVMIIVIVKIFP